jgi:hypothetical protein
MHDSSHTEQSTRNIRPHEASRYTRTSTESESEGNGAMAPQPQRRGGVTKLHTVALLHIVAATAASHHDAFLEHTLHDTQATCCHCATATAMCCTPHNRRMHHTPRITHCATESTPSDSDTRAGLAPHSHKSCQVAQRRRDAAR